MKTLVWACVMSIFLGSAARAQSDLTSSNFVVVIGAFASHSNAEHFVAQAKRRQLNPSVELNKFRNLYYVYVSQSGDRERAMNEAKQLRDSTPFKDTWVFNGTLGDLASANQGQDIHPVTQQLITPVESPKEQVVEVVAVEAKPEPVDSAKLREEWIKSEVAKEVMSTKKGEMARLNHIYFFKDAAVMRPESRYEVDKLVKLMKDNPTQKIRIHGHTNGNDAGKIIKRNDDTSDFFSLDNTVEDYGSAKELSELRATIIRSYLASNGIDKKRMSIKAWGGKKPVYKVDDDRAEANVRVEVEVVNQEE